MQPANYSGSINHRTLVNLPGESLVLIIQYMSDHMERLRSQVAELEQRNRMLQDQLPEIIRQTIASTMSSSRGSVKSENEGTNNRGTPPATVASGTAPSPVIPPIGLMPLQLNPTLPPDSSALINFFNTVLHSRTSIPPAQPSTQIGSPSSPSPLIRSPPPLPPLQSVEADDEPISPAEEDFPTPPLSCDGAAATAQWRSDAVSSAAETEQSCVSGGGGGGVGRCGEALMSDEELRQVEEEDILAATSPFSSMSSTQSDVVSTPSLHAAQERARHWEVFSEAKDWKRATCALMSCLFSRFQMAHSTVYGRPSFGNMARQRLPLRHVRYIVTKITRRFGVSPVKVRARMAQKCKDLRRLMRNKNGEKATTDMSGGTTTPVPILPGGNGSASPSSLLATVTRARKDSHPV